MWGEQLIREDEDEAALKADFVRLSALYPNASPIEIGNHVFRSLKDPGMRGASAGTFWSMDLAIQERIREYKLTGGRSEQVITLPTKEEALAEVVAIARDTRQDAKDRNQAWLTYLKAQGHITEKVDKTVTDKAAPAFPQFVIKRYEDDASAS